MEARRVEHPYDDPGPDDAKKNRDAARDDSDQRFGMRGHRVERAHRQDHRARERPLQEAELVADEPMGLGPVVGPTQGAQHGGQGRPGQRTEHEASMTGRHRRRALLSSVPAALSIIAPILIASAPTTARSARIARVPSRCALRRDDSSGAATVLTSNRTRARDSIPPRPFAPRRDLHSVSIPPWPREIDAAWRRRRLEARAGAPADDGPARGPWPPGPSSSPPSLIQR